MNDKFGDYIKQIPLTDPVSAHGYSLLHWQQSREVGYDADNRDRYGNVDYNKNKAREEKIAEGKIPPEDFDTAVASSSLTWYESLAADLTLCQEEAKRLDALLDEKFGRQAPSLSQLLAAIEESDRFVSKTLKEKRAREPAPKPVAEQPPESSQEPEVPPKGGVIARLFKRHQEPASESESEGESNMNRLEELGEVEAPGPFSDSRRLETLRWEEALTALETAGIKEALGKLLHASSSAPSIRERNRYQLLMAKLCLEADRPDLARPMVEELQALIEELHLERWESPLWIAEVLDALYQCLTKGDVSNQDVSRTKLLLEKLCTTDVTKAMNYRL
jgi:type VI secretion system protein ImpA